MTVEVTVPSICERTPPVTLLMMFCIVFATLKFAVLPVPTLNCPKL